MPEPAEFPVAAVGCPTAAPAAWCLFEEMSLLFLCVLGLCGLKFAVMGNIWNLQIPKPQHGFGRMLESFSATATSSRSERPGMFPEGSTLTTHPLDLRTMRSR